MSHIGRKPIEIPENVEVEIKKQRVKIKGPKGELEREVRPEISIKKEDGSLVFSLKEERKDVKKYWGTERSLVNNFIQGVTKGFEKKLRLEGIGYRAKTEKDKLILEIGFSHDVEVVPPEGVEVNVKGKIIKVEGIDKAKVNQTAAKIRSLRKPDPYTGKGIRYEGEEIKLKPGKKAISSEV